MALEWLRTILGAAYTPEIDAAVAREIGAGFVDRAEFNTAAARAAHLEEQAARLKEDVRDREAQLSRLRQSAADGEALARRIEELERQIGTDRAGYEKQLAAVRLDAAVDAELAAAGARNNTAVKAVLADFLGQARLADGKVVSGAGEDAAPLSAKLEAMKRDADTDFLFGTIRRAGWKPGEGSGGKKPGGKRPAEMSYSELTAYLAENPDARLEE